MTTISRSSTLVSLTFKTGASSLLVLGLLGCEGLARFAARPDQGPAQPPTLEELRPAQPPVAAVESPKEPDKPIKGPLYEWKGTGQPITRIVINTDEQKARFYAGDTEIGWSTVATGVPKYPTPTGNFRVTEKIENKRSNLYGKIYGQGGQVIRANAKAGRDPIPEGARFEGAHMPFYMRLTGDGIGLHAGPIPNPGRPASHGCIRMPSKIAPVVFKHVSTGTAVTIEGKGPTYSEYLAQQRAQAARVAAASPTKAPSTPVAPATDQPKPPAENATPAPTPPASGPEVVANDQAPIPTQTPALAPTGPTEQQTTSAPATPPQPAPTTPAAAQPPAVPPPPAAPAPAQAAKPETVQPTAPPEKPAEAPAPGATPQGQTPPKPEPPQQPPAPAPAPASPKPQEPAPVQPSPAPAPTPAPAAPPQAAAPA